MSKITHVNHLVEDDHAVIFVKTADGEEHAFEFGRHHAKGGHAHAKPHGHDHHGHDHHSQGKTGHAAEDVKHMGHEQAADADDHAKYNAHHYAVHVHSPFAKADHGKVGVPKGEWSEVSTEFTPDALAHQLKEEWYKDHVGCFVFESEKSFDAHVLALLSQ